ncbi:hypothetical protein ABG79_00398 [Caloramator mitchellensis]|uniref:Uncharacterized protein n=1 Tax=Caloramator mitchellensis TaxID=908809 RepID=A0A0R3JZ65_CALMK|nr:hypothetical protein [Caloramator mitchellensis]KRQ87597.1 hypothetical protein ABG79_00398 [Caloramator mitchellensis]
MNEIDKSIESIINSEAKIAECLSCLFCNIADELKYTNPIEKRVSLTSEVVEAYSCKEKAMADLINSANCLYRTTQHCFKKEEQLKTILYFLILLFVFRRIFTCC